MVNKVNFIYVLAVEDHCLTSRFLFEIVLFVAKTVVVQRERGREKIQPALLQTFLFSSHLFLLLHLIFPFPPDSGVLALGPYGVTNSSRLYIFFQNGLQSAT